MIIGNSSGSSLSPEPPILETQFVSQTDDSQNLWEAERILDERGPPAAGSYLVQWKGIDPATKEQYAPTWAQKNGCTPGLIADWKAYKKEDPSVVGKASKELERAKWKERKRKRRRISVTTKVIAKKKKLSAAGDVQKENSMMATSSSRVLRQSGHSPASTQPSASPGTVPRPPRWSLTLTRNRTIPVEGEIPDPQETESTRAESSSSIHDGSPRSPDSAQPTASPQAAARKPRLSIRFTKPVPVEDTSPVLAKQNPSDPAFRSSPKAASRERNLVEVETPRKPSVMWGPDVISDADVGVMSTSGEAEIDDGVSDVPPTNGNAQIPPQEKISSPSEVQPNEEVNAQGKQSLSVTPKKKTTIHLSDKEPAQAGPGLETNGTKEKASPSSRFGPVPEPSLSVSRPSLPTPDATFHTETDRSVHISQLDPIVDFSSPARPVLDGMGVRGRRDEDTHLASQVTTADGVDEANDEVAESLPPKVVKRIIDGEEVYAVWTESMGDEDMDVVKTEPIEHEARDEWEDADLASLTSEPVQHKVNAVDVVEDTSGGAIAYLCEDGGCGKVLTSSVELANHKQKHTATIAPVELVLLPQQDSPADAERHILALTAQLQERNDKIDELAVRLTQSGSTMDGMITDVEFFRSEYLEARGRVITQIQRTAKLEEQVETLRGQLTLGLKQRDIHFDAVKTQRAAEVEKYRVQNKVLLDQARLTDDIVRRKASQYGSLKKENDSLKEIAYEEQMKIIKLQKRNEELVDQVEYLRAKQMGIFEDVEDDLSGTDQDQGSSSSLGGEIPSQLGSQARHDKKSSSSLHHSSSQLLPEESIIKMEEAAHKDLVSASSPGSLVDAGVGLRCKWRQDGVQCTVLLETLEDIAQHCSDHTAGRVDVLGESVVM